MFSGCLSQVQIDLGGLCQATDALTQIPKLGIVLVLVVVLVLDLWDLGAENRARSFGNYLLPSL
jgi:hypothetical protein